MEHNKLYKSHSHFNINMNPGDPQGLPDDFFLDEGGKTNGRNIDFY